MKCPKEAQLLPLSVSSWAGFLSLPSCEMELVMPATMLLFW